MQQDTTDDTHDMYSGRSEIHQRPLNKRNDTVFPCAKSPQEEMPTARVCVVREGGREGGDERGWVMSEREGGSMSLSRCGVPTQHLRVRAGGTICPEPTESPSHQLSRWLLPPLLIGNDMAAPHSCGRNGECL